ncbi:MAG: class I SAM-dependent methyltransferase [Chitinophagaceae bacterium]
MIQKRFFLAYQYIKYFITAKTAHGVHSPFVYQFIENVLKQIPDKHVFENIFKLRKTLASQNNNITFKDMGAGSVVSKTNTRSISSIAKYAARTHKYGKVLYSIIQYYKPSKIIELGTSLGIGSSYLALANKEATIHTIEGSPEIAKLAYQHWKEIGIENIVSHVGHFDNTLQTLLSDLKQIDCIVIDGNHSYEPTIQYTKWALQHAHEKSIFIYDDIHWSKGMQKAWNEIISYPEVTLSIDIFQLGIVFFNPDFKEKQHFILKY